MFGPQQKIEAKVGGGNECPLLQDYINKFYPCDFSNLICKAPPLPPPELDELNLELYSYSLILAIFFMHVYIQGI